MFFREKEMKQWCFYVSKGDTAEALTYFEMAKYLASLGHSDSWIKEYVKNTKDMERIDET